MSAATLSAFGKSNFADDNSTAESVATSWSAGDLIVVLGVTGDNGGTLNTPTATGLTFSLATATTGTNPTNTASRCKGYIWTATAGSSGSGTISASHGGSSQFSGIYVWVWSSHGGVGKVITDTTASAITTSMVRSGANSRVAWALGDWNATNDTTVTGTPGSSTQENAEFISGQFTTFAFDWPDQGSSGTTSYGISGFSSNRNMQLAIEILAGTGGTTNVSESDSATESDSGTVSATATGSDTGSETDSASASVTANSSDSGTGTDAAAVSATVPGSDSGAATETDSTSVTGTGSDTGSGSESASTFVTLSSSDSGTATDAQVSIVSPVSGSDTGTETETDSTNVTGSGSETGTGSESASTSVTASGSDSATATEAGTVGDTSSGGDSGAALEGATTLNATVPGSDSGSGSEAATASVTASGADSATATDAGTVQDLGATQITGSDSFAATDDQVSLDISGAPVSSGPTGGRYTGEGDESSIYPEFRAITGSDRAEFRDWLAIARDITPKPEPQLREPIRFTVRKLVKIDGSDGARATDASRFDQTIVVVGADTAAPAVEYGKVESLVDDTDMNIIGELLGIPLQEAGF